ncbi:hypothetical protein H696_05856 [Fonticula alba]|uniref:TKL protein kinase n=1 Tax=Fonticula alba TaxID=691883 RepID=A0A058Z0S8_FONAL|nr:hypothetical protein H696_05856 [Fonticula alba]KCV67746.1 hypothetical protein H696_05856 [Fonticula alba]|eukprot:XP_009497930.1 hypothetical protein H696_05856 [Fonticula alba]
MARRRFPGPPALLPCLSLLGLVLLLTTLAFARPPPGDAPAAPAPKHAGGPLARPHAAPRAACPAECTACNESGCTRCRPGLYLHLGDPATCTDTCPSEPYTVDGVAYCQPNLVENCLYYASTGGRCAECMTGFFLEGPWSCRPCSTLNCYHCDPGGRCFGCHPGFYLAGYDCLPCSSGCTQCSSAGYCTACAAGHFLHEDACVSACPPGHAPGPDRQCVPCPSSCTSCAAGGVCTACAPGYHLTGQACTPCPAGCSTCTGPTACTACHTGHVLHRGTCGTSCPGGFFPDAKRGMCAGCPAGCGACAGPTGPCSACQPGFFLHQRACVTICPAGFVETNAPSGPHCAPCSAGCLACEAALHDGAPGRCFTCQEDRYLHEGQCVGSCPAGTFTSAEGNRCDTCPAACARCTAPPAAPPTDATAPAPGTDIPRCSACRPGFFLNDWQCVPSCPTGTFPSGERCLPCGQGCSRCQSAKICEMCEPTFHRHNDVCMEACPPGHYNTHDLSSGNVCQPCFNLCAECKGPNVNDCTKCQAPLTIRQPIPPVSPPKDHGDCVPDCMNDPSQCVECGRDCELCRRAPHDPAVIECLVCRYGLVTLDGNCVEECPRRHTLLLGGHCARCSPTCGDTCSGPASTQCMSCPKNKVLQAGECRDACSAFGWFADSSISCARCDPSCAQCQAPGPNGCSACPRGSLRLAAEVPPAGAAARPAGTMCVTSCPQGMFSDLARGECRPCHGSCRECIGPGADNCLSCTNAEDLLFRGACMAACPAGHFAPARARAAAPKDAGPRQCEPCPTGCTTCDPAPSDAGTKTRSDLSCTSCSEGFLLLPGPPGDCVFSCPTGFWPNVPERRCIRCSAACSRCIEPHGACTVCADPNHRLRPSTGRCIDTCDPATEAEGISPTGQLSCQPCHPTCQGCLRPGDEAACVACPVGRHLHAGACLEVCPAGYFTAPEAGGVCLACVQPCATCDGPTPAHCLSCRGDLLLRQGSCHTDCPVEEHWLDAAARVCHPCTAGCDRCDRAGCTACKAGLLMLRLDPHTRRLNTSATVASAVTEPMTTCVQSCPGGFYPEHFGGQRMAECVPCAPGCHTCTGPDEHLCELTWCQADMSCMSTSRTTILGVSVGLCLLILLLVAGTLVYFLVVKRARLAKPPVLAPAPPPAADDENSTIMNTVLDLALPGFLLLSYHRDLRIDRKAPSGCGSQGGVFPVAALSSRLLESANDTPLVIKMPNDAPQMNMSVTLVQVQAMFKNELSILWALQSSPNVVKLFGYTEDPSTLVLERYQADMMNLLDSTPGPLGGDDLSSILQGLAALNHMAADIFSLGAVIWHLLSHARPWNGLLSSDIATRVQSGELPDSYGPGLRLDAPGRPAPPPIALKALSLLHSLWAFDPASRPLASHVSAQILAPPE